MTGFRWRRRMSAVCAATTIAFGIQVGFPAAPVQAAPDNGPVACDHLIGMRDAYYDVYLRARNDESLLVAVGRYTWDATDAGCFGTDAALRQRALLPSMSRP